MGIREPIKLNPHLTRQPLKEQNSWIPVVLNPLHIRTTGGSQWELDASWWGFDASVCHGQGASGDCPLGAHWTGSTWSSCHSWAPLSDMGTVTELLCQRRDSRGSGVHPARS